jgi:hypothetical protein
VSERSRVLRGVNKSSAEIGNTFWELITKQEGTQTRAIFGGTVNHRSYSFAGVRTGEQIFMHSFAVEKINTRWRNSTYTNTQVSKFIPSKPSKGRHTISSDFKVAASFFK